MAARKTARHAPSPILISALIGVATFLALMAILVAVYVPVRYDLRAGEVSPITITASKDVEDSYTYQQQVQQAMDAVPVSYTLDESVQDAVLADLNAFFDALDAVRLGETDVSAPPVTLSEGISLDADDVALITGLDGDTLTAIRADTQTITDELLSSRITEDGVDEALNKLGRELSESEQYDTALVDVVARGAKVWLRPNMLIDQETTEYNRQRAAESVEHIVYIRGRNIVRSGEIITDAQIAMLESLGLLTDGATVDVLRYIGVALLVALVFAMLIVYMVVFEKGMIREPRMVSLLCVIILVTCGVCALVQYVNQFLVPVALGVMLAALLIRPRFALVVSAALGVLAGLINAGINGSFSTSLIIVVMTTLISGTLCAALLRGKTQRVIVLLSGLLVSGSNMLTTLAVGLVTETNTTNVLLWSLWSAGSGLLAAVLCIGLQPALEWMFNLVTSAKLMELSNPNHPLIRQMILEASGTYHHSIIVANLAEAAANEIGANGLLARVGAYYHDVGKLKRPLYFKENQIGDNPHDRTDPLVSAAILTAHPTDGVELAMKYRMPRQILDIIQQHHGDTPVMYFYDRCVRQSGESNVDINDFRYPGPRPQTREAAIVMLADTVEAAARTAPDRTNEGLDKLIRELIRAKIDDGQLNESPITLADIEKATQAFVTVLSGVFHQRIKYPELKIPSRREKKAPTADSAAQLTGDETDAQST